MDLTLAYVLIGVGFILLVAELFIPSAGMLTVLSVTCMISGIVLAFKQGSTTGWVTLGGVFLAVPVVVGLLLHYWPKTAMGKRFILTGVEGASAEDEAEEKELEALIGKIGRTLSPLRPSGVVDFDGHRIDTLTEGILVDRDQLVRCIAIRGGKVVVRPVQGPERSEPVDFENV